MLGIIIQVKTPVVATISVLMKNAETNMAIEIGKDRYPTILWATFQVSSSRIVQGSLNPIYLLNGILGDRLPKNIINIEHNPTSRISLVLESKELSIGDSIENIELMMIIKIVSLFKVLIVLILGLSSDNFAIFGAFISNITKARIDNPPIIEIVKLPFGIIKPPIKINNDVIRNNTLVKSNFFTIEPPFYFVNRFKKFPRTSWIIEVLIE